MRGSIAIWGLAGIILVILVGVLVFRSTSPESDMTGIEIETDMSIVEEPNGNGSQLLRMQPNDLPSSEGRDENVEVSEELDAVEDPVEDLVPEESKPIAFEIVEITDTGFEPNEITVAAGTQVTWLNNGQALHWPASDNHPTHELLAGFDALKGLSTGEEYSFVFNEVGTWEYHDHLMSSVTGTVVVTSRPSGQVSPGGAGDE